ncbi:hypothetical protein, partial [Micromonospora foliorum]|uniref:hypothetical protein n=1 Tax=Micromonospora foliorum TaxID=2911210 RepID=UPI001EE96F77
RPKIVLDPGSSGITDAVMPLDPGSSAIMRGWPSAPGEEVMRGGASVGAVWWGPLLSVRVRVRR